MFAVVAKTDYSVVNNSRLNIAYSGLYPILLSSVFTFNSLIEDSKSLTSFIATSSNKASFIFYHDLLFVRDEVDSCTSL